MDYLKGLRILDLTRLLPGPFCTRLLADLGADVVKLEDLKSGDYAREIHRQIFAAMNHGKRSLALDVRRAAGRKAFLRLLPRFDVLIEGFRPGVMARNGLGYEQLREVHPGLIYCSLVGYGQSDSRSGHDINYMAQAGLLAGATDPLTVPVADFCGGYAAALRIVAAWKCGQGCFLDVSLTASVLPMTAVRQAGGHLEGGLACYNIYPTADGGQFSLGAIEPKFFAAFLEAAGRPELAAKQFDLAAQAKLKAELRAIFLRRTRQEWVAFFEGIDACGAAVLSPDEIPGIQTTGPGHGEHTEQVLGECGFSPEEIAALRVQGAIR